MKHIELLKAWIDGETIQHKNSDGEWVDLKRPDFMPCCPGFFDSDQYRKKPNTIKYRRWLAKQGSFDVDPRIGIVYNQKAAEEVFLWQRFVRWIDTEWQEEEV